MFIGKGLKRDQMSGGYKLSWKSEYDKPLNSMERNKTFISNAVNGVILRKAKV